MKYGPVQIKSGEHKGKWAIAARGNKYYTNWIRDTEKECLADCALKSMYWHHDKAREAYEEYLKATDQDEHDCYMSDLLA